MFSDGHEIAELLVCTLELTRAQLESMCNSLQDAGKGFVEHVELLSFGRSTEWTHIAAFGDASLENIEDWISVIGKQETEVANFVSGSSSTASLSVCSSVVVGIDFEIIYSPFGESANPQMKIVAARVTQRRGSLAFTNMVISRPQPFHFTVTVKFLELNDVTASQAHVAPKPQLPLKMPHELWYPFSMTSAGVHFARSAFVGVSIASLSQLVLV